MSAYGSGGGKAARAEHRLACRRGDRLSTLLAMASRFKVAQNPSTRSNLPYLVWLPIDDGLVLRAREPWPITSRVFCHDSGDEWPAEPDIVDDVAVRSCRRRGAAVDLVVDRGRNNRSQFVFTQLADGRPAIFWQTAKTTRAARPGARMPTRRAAGQDDLVIVRDRRERYGYRFAAQQADVTAGTLPAGDYAVFDAQERPLAVVERKSFDNFVSALVDGSLVFQLAELADLPRAAVVVEGRYEQLLELAHVQPGWVLDLVARVQVRHPAVPIVWAGSRKHAEEWTFRFLGAARADLDVSAQQAD